MTPAIHAEGLGKRYRRGWALRDCSLDVPTGSIAALVGPNGAGKSTLLNLIVGLLSPTEGSLEAFGLSPQTRLRELLPRIGFMAQDHPLYRDFSVDEMLTMGRRLNARWDAAKAERRLAQLRIPLHARVKTLSGGQLAQVALTLAIGKQPDLLLLDEPLASVDPLARRELLGALMAWVSESGATVLLSSHDLGYLERVCDHLVILGDGSVLLAGAIDDILSSHRRLVGLRRDFRNITNVDAVVQSHSRGRQNTLLARVSGPIIDPSWEVQEVTLEDVVLAYLGASNRGEGWSETGLRVAG